VNIFVVDLDPAQAARDLCNQHCVKMVTESAQLLATCFPRGTVRFKYTHVNHPCAKWVRQSLSNYKWLVAHGLWLAEEYSTRYYGRVLKSTDVLLACAELTPDMPDVGLTPFARAFKPPWNVKLAGISDVVEAYRAYYIGDKSRFARWAPRAVTPDWWPVQGA